MPFDLDTLLDAPTAGAGASAAFDLDGVIDDQPPGESFGDSFMRGARGAMEGPRAFTSTIARGFGILRRPIDEAATFYSRAAVGANPVAGDTESAGQIAAQALVPSGPENAGSDINLPPDPIGIGAVLQSLEAARRVHAPAAEHVAGVARAGVRLAGDLATDPTAAVLGEMRAAGAGGQAMERAVAAAFAGDMGAGAAESARLLGDEVGRNGWTPRATEMATELATQTGMGYMAGRGALSPEAPPPPSLQDRTRLSERIARQREVTDLQSSLGRSRDERGAPVAPPGKEVLAERPPVSPEPLPAIAEAGPFDLDAVLAAEPDAAAPARELTAAAEPGVPLREVGEPPRDIRAANERSRGVPSEVYPDNPATALEAAGLAPPEKLGEGDGFARAIEQATDQPPAAPRLVPDPVRLSPRSGAAAAGPPSAELAAQPIRARVPAGYHDEATALAEKYARAYEEIGRVPTVAEMAASLPDHLRPHAEAITAEIVGRAAGRTLGRDMLTTLGAEHPAGEPGTVAVYDTPDPGTFDVVQWGPEGKAIGGATVRGGDLTMIAGGRAMDSGFSIRPVYETLDARGVKRNEILTPYGAAARDSGRQGYPRPVGNDALPAGSRPASAEVPGGDAPPAEAGPAGQPAAPRQAQEVIPTGASPKKGPAIFDGDAALGRLSKPDGKVNDLGSAIATGGRVVKDVLTYGASLIERGARSFPEWSRAMTEALGSTFSDLGQHLRRLYGEAKREYLSRAEAASKAPVGSDTWMRHPERGAVKVGGGDPFLDNRGLDSPVPVGKRAPATAQPGEALSIDSDPAKKLVDLVRKAPPVLKETEVLRHGERIRRASEVRKIAAGVQGEQGLRAAKQALSGDLPRADFAAVRPKLAQGEIDGLFNRIWAHSDLRPYERVRAADALYNILDAAGGRLPQRNELVLLEKVFGKQISEAILSKRGVWARTKEGLIDAANLPRALMSSFDMSAPLRQGLILTVGRPKQAAGAFGGMMRSFFGEKAYKAIDADIAARPNAHLYDATDLYLAGRERALDLSAREERFMSNLAEKVPGMGWIVRASERAYVSYLNKLRADVFDSITTEFRKGGITPEASPKTFEALAEYINVATGRGSLGPLERSAAVMNAGFFSPRFMAARLQTLNPVRYMNMPKQVRMQAMRDGLSVLGAGLTVLSLAKLGGATVEDDPRSSDFGKVKLGETRIDVWGGFQQWVRFIAQVTSGQRVSISGHTYNLDGKPPFGETRLSTAGRFVRTKLAPAPALLADWADAKRDVVGRQTDWKRIADTVIPMYVQDATAAMREHGPAKGFLISTPAFFGVGVSTYERQERGARP